MKTVFRSLAILLVTVGFVHAESTLYFGSGGTVEVDKLEWPADSDAFTVECRFKPLGRVAGSLPLVSRWSDDPESKDKGSFSLGLRMAETIAFSLRDDKGQVKTVSTRAKVTVGKWHHLVASFDGETVSVFLDGASIVSDKLTGIGKLGVTSQPLRIGPPVQAQVRRPVLFDGFIADVAIWSQARDAETIKRSLGELLGSSKDSLVLHVPLRETGAPTTIKCAGGTAKLTGALSVGWTITSMWHEAEPERPFVHLFGYDLSKAENGNAGSPDNAFRQILVTNDAKQQPGLLWQDKGSGKVYVTWVESDFSGQKTTGLETLENSTLAAGTADPKGNLYYLMIEKRARSRPESNTLKANMYAVSSKGKTLRKAPLNMAKNAFNVFRFSGRWGSSLQYHNGVLGLILPRTMHKGGDGLNHQGGIAAVLSASTLQVIKRLGQTSGHSFGNTLTVNTKGEFIGVDLGDNYPRGVHLHKITPESRASRVVYTFKTRHDTRSRNGSKVYKEISGNGKTFYKSSNDNGVYSELGGAVEGRTSYSVIFATDRSLEGKVLDNSRAVRGNGDPRNLAMLRVVKTFDRVESSGSEVSDALMAGMPKGAKVETSGFYNFGGRWSKQRVTGVIWLTEYGKGEMAHAPRLLKLQGGKILILWEKSGAGKSSLQAMIVQESGKVELGPVDLGQNLHLNRHDSPIRLGNRLLLLARDRTKKTTKLHFVNDGGSSSGGGPAPRKRRWVLP